jgi:DAK2 domain fusion protein YloV
MVEAHNFAGNAERTIPDCLGPEDWCVALNSAARWVGVHTEHLNGLNVFPVPDGDTGTNMYLTLKAAAEACSSGRNEGALQQTAERAAKGALLAARGNSGVILAQALIAMAASFENSPCADGAVLAKAFMSAAKESYSVLLHPVEGTILTVIRRAAEAAQRVAMETRAAGPVLRAALEAAGLAVDETPKLLDVLAEAGVVDAGGEGFRLTLEGMLYGLEGRRLPEPHAVLAAPSDTAGAHLSGQVPTFCTTVTLKEVDDGLSNLREGLGRLGDSVVVIANSSFVKVHVHTDDPARVMSWLSERGEIQEVKVDRITSQSGLPVARAYQPVRPLDLVAVAEGEGFKEIFLRLGVRVVDAKELSPTVEDLLRAIEGCSSEAVAVLPNDPNILSVARQAARLSRKKVEVLDTRTVQEGLAAAIAFSPDVTLEENLINMQEAAKRVVSIRVVQAVKHGRVAGTTVRAGQYLGIVEGNGVALGDTPSEAVLRAVEGLGQKNFSLVSIYYGENVSAEQLKDLVELIKKVLPCADYEVNWGGQRQSLLLIALEY